MSKPLCYYTGALISSLVVRWHGNRTVVLSPLPLRISLKRLALPVGCMTFQLRLTMVLLWFSMRLDYECGCLLVLGSRYEKKTDCLLRRSVFSHTFTWGDPHTPSVSSSTNEGAFWPFKKVNSLCSLRSATVDFSVFVCVCLSVDNSANNSLTSKYCVVALFSLTHKKH